MIFSRREFLKTGASVFAIGAGVPGLVMSIAKARADENNQSTKDRILVVFELTGGNDGMNMVVPIKDPLYTSYRPSLAIPQTDVLMLNDAVGFHPSMTAMHDMFKDNKLAVIQGAGYPNANRSHFRSMEIWHRGDPGDDATNGWLGRWYDKTDHPPQSVVPLVFYGQKRPEMFKGNRAPALSIDSIDDFYPSNKKPESVAVSTLYNGKNDATSMGMAPPAAGKDDQAMSADELIQATGMDIVRGTETIKKILAHPRKPQAVYPDGRIGHGLSVFTQMIVENTGTKLFYINMDGFDTHSNQAGTHTRLLGMLSNCLSAFYKDLAAENRDKDVVTMVFSEFGRRAHENGAPGTAGTDHGSASIMFFAGGSIKGGLHGDYPALAKLTDGGDLAFNVDFRDCYATVLENWLGTDANRVLPGHKGRAKFL